MGDSYYVQLELHPDARTADMEFILNNACGKKQLEFPKFFEIKNMDYGSNETGITFLRNATETQRKQIEDINSFFSSFAPIEYPLEADLEDGKIVVQISLVTAKMAPVEARTDMKFLHSQLEAKKKGLAPPTTRVPELTGAALNVSMASANGASGHLEPLVWLVLVMFPLAEGMNEWLMRLF